MRDIPAAILTELAKRQGLKTRVLAYFTAKDRATGNPASLGLWSGIDARDFTINGQTRTYYGAGSVLSFGQLSMQKGLYIKKQSLTLSQLTPEVMQLFRGYDIKGAAVEIHNVFFNTETDNIIATPQRRFKGWVDKINGVTPKKNEAASLTVSCVGNSRLLTKILPQKKSPESQRQRNSADEFFSYAPISGQVNTPWGDKGTGGNFVSGNGVRMTADAIRKAFG